jgi:D-beta-D-heptose 7-phosphate kinase/D-beta-D-heptose 1-phosphate adenosyltransferase
MLESIKYIDVVLPFGSRQELEQSIQLYNPDILLVGGDWRNGDVVGREFAKEVRFFNRVGGYSSTNVIDSIANKYINAGGYL